MASSTPTTTFESFPRLAVELRLKIWNYAIDDLPRRVVSIIPEPRPSPPATAHCCIESRIETLKSYAIISSRKCSLYFNYKKDALYLTDQFFDMLQEEAYSRETAFKAAIEHYGDILRQVKTLVLSFGPAFVFLYSDFSFIYSRGPRLYPWISENCPNLRTLHCVGHRIYRQLENGGGIFVPSDRDRNMDEGPSHVAKEDEQVYQWADDKTEMEETLEFAKATEDSPALLTIDLKLVMNYEEDTKHIFDAETSQDE